MDYGTATSLELEMELVVGRVVQSLEPGEWLGLARMEVWFLRSKGQGSGPSHMGWEERASKYLPPEYRDLDGLYDGPSV